MSLLIRYPDHCGELLLGEAQHNAAFADPPADIVATGVVQVPFGVSAGCFSAGLPSILSGSPVARLAAILPTAENLTDLAARLGLGSAYLVTFFEDAIGLLDVGAVVSYPGAGSHIIAKGDSFRTLLEWTKTDAEGLAKSLTVTTGPLLTPGFTLGACQVSGSAAPPSTGRRQTLQAVADCFETDMESLLLAGRRAGQIGSRDGRCSGSQSVSRRARQSHCSFVR
jgi:hypothetical protein